MTFLKLYLRRHRRSVFLFFLFFLIFLVSFYLYHLPLKAVLYPAFLCFLIGTLLSIFDIVRTLKRHRSLVAVGQLSAELIDSFPAVTGVEDADYQQIIRLLCEEYRNRQTVMDRRYKEMIDYYTLWAHQIKTPIAAMHLRLQTEDTALSRSLSFDLSRIERYVEMVMVFLRLDSDFTDYVIKEQDLDLILRDTIKKFAGEFIAQHLRLLYEPLQVTVVTDEKWLSFVIEQVLSNALKYTRSGYISITLESPKTLCIRDTGIGIAPEDLPRIFDQGYTGYNGRSDKRASGIGLYLCRRICRRLGHHICAESTPGVGTCIRIDLAQDQLNIE